MFEQLRKLIKRYRELLEELAAYNRDEDTRRLEDIDGDLDAVKDAIVDCVDNNF